MCVCVCYLSGGGDGDDGGGGGDVGDGGGGGGDDFILQYQTLTLRLMSINFWEGCINSKYVVMVFIV